MTLDMCVRAPECEPVPVCAYVWMCACPHSCVSAHVYTFVCMLVNMHADECILAYTHACVVVGGGDPGWFLPHAGALPASSSGLSGVEHQVAGHSIGRRRILVLLERRPCMRKGGQGSGGTGRRESAFIYCCGVTGPLPLGDLEIQDCGAQAGGDNSP